MLKNQNFKIEWKTIEDYRNFTTELQTVCDKLNVFYAGIGEVYINALGQWDGDCVDNVKTVSDVLFTHRAGIKLLKEYDRKPAPQKHFIGEWFKVK